MDDRIEENVSRLISDAASEADARSWEKARALAEAAIALQPGNAEAQLILARADAALSPGERRQLTVVFCDVVGSTALSGVADPEVMRDVLSAYQSACARVVVERGGYIAQLLGDGVLAYFGYPTAHEDDARRAVDAGLDILAAMEDVGRAVRQRHNLDFGVRVAAHTGLVVRAEMTAAQHRQRDAIVGETPNLAARLQSRAHPGTLVISGATYQLVRGFFTCEPLGRLDFRGVSFGVDVYEVTARTLAETRLEADREPAPFVGRRLELARLGTLWEKVEHYGSASVLIQGEPGVGKSRLALVFRQRIEFDGGAAVSCACSAYRMSTPLYPIRRLLASVLGVDFREAAEDAIRLLGAVLSSIGREHLLTAFADLIGLPPAENWAPIELEPQQLRQEVLDTLVEWVRFAARRAPLMIVIDDLQWSDPSTLDLIHRLIATEMPGLLLMMTARDELPTLGGAVEIIDLGRLADVDLRDLLSALPEGRGLSGLDISLMIRRSEGVPLYLEELVRAGPSRPSGVEAVLPAESRFTVPPALLEPLLARLASPQVDLSLVQVMATIGQEADARLLEQVTGLPPVAMRERVSGLVRAQLIEVSEGDRPIYRFRHQLLGEVAYQMQLLPVRRGRHSVIADVLSALNPPHVPVDAGALAYHLERSDRLEEAVMAHVRAAAESMAHGGFAEAIGQFDHAMELVGRFDDRKVQLALELIVRQARGMAWVSLAGYASPGAASDLERCADLCRELGSAVDGVPSLMVVLYYSVIRGELDRAEDVLLIDRQRLAPDPEAIPVECAWGGIRFGRGQISDAIKVMEAFLTSPYSRNLGSTPTQWPLPDDPVVVTWATLGLARWMAADATGAEEAFRNAEDRSRKLDFPHGPFCRAYVLLIRTLVYQLAADLDQADAAVREMDAIATRHSFALFTICANLHRTWTGTYDDLASSIPLLEAAFADFRLLGMDLWNPWGSTMLADALLRAGDSEGALRYADEANAEAQRTGAMFWSAETMRIRGLARLAHGDRGGTQDLEQAASIAMGQGALLFELRANLDLLRFGARDRWKRLGDLVAGLPSSEGVPEVEAVRQLFELGPPS
jgi:class 3 adenylate cyclase